jgi:predicted LPLAT superfamily acyltransferase
MKALFYKALTAAAKVYGTWVFTLLSGGIATGYFLFSRRLRGVGLRFYAALFPHRGRFYHYDCTWRQFRNFTYVWMDRFIQSEMEDLNYTIEGKAHVTTLLSRRTGGILLMSHMGNWEVAAHLLRKALPGLRLMLLMGIRRKEEIEKIQKESVRDLGVRVIAIDRGGGSPFDIVEAIGFLRTGGFVSMAGDRVWRDDQRTVTGVFLGHRVRLPEAPFVLALVSGAPLIAFFAFRTGSRQYEVSAMPPIHVTAVTRDKRSEAVQNAAQCYLDHMAAALRLHPFEWYHFDDFLEVEKPTLLTSDV